MPALSVGADDDGVRLDRYLRRRLPHLPLSAIFRMLRRGSVKVNGARAAGNDRIHGGDTVDVRVAEVEVATDGLSDTERLSRLSSTEFFRRNFRIVFEDEAMIACDKPAGLVVHPGSGHTSADTLIDLANAHMLRTGPLRDEHRPWLVHRLDRDTSGIILLARGRHTLRRLHESLRTGSVTKQYLAVCHGRLPRPQGVVETDLVRTFERNDGMKVRVGDGDEKGQWSRSTYRVSRQANGVSLVEVGLETGRTHQIRVQMAHLGCPVAGDERYGNTDLDTALFARPGAQRRLYLHAWRLRIPHPITGVEMSFEVAPPECFEKVLTRT